jgi:hypothetical protein
MTTIGNGSIAGPAAQISRPPIHRLRRTVLAATVLVTAALAAAMQPAQAQDTTVLRGSPPTPASSVDCSNPYYYQYCQDYAAWQDQNYPLSSYGQNYVPDIYGDTYPYYGYGFPVGVGVGLGFVHHRGFEGGGGFHGGGFHGGGFHGGGFHGGGFHGGGFHGGGGHR